MDREKRKLIFFDFDGVIADSFSPAFRVSKMIHPLLEPEDYRRRFDGNINETVVDSRVQKEHRPDIDFFTEYGPLLLGCRVFPGMRNVIEKLEKEYSLVIVSSTTTSLISEFLKKHHMEHHFAEIMGNDIHKSKIKKIGMALDKYKVAPSECFFVTDTLGDINESRHMGVEAIAVTWGYHSKESLIKGNPFAVADTTEELLNLLK
jgi:phosphoglycolate phosphatase